MKKYKTRQHPLDVDDDTLEIFDSAVNHAEAVLQTLLPDMSPEEITDRFQKHVAIHMETELEGAKRYGNNALKYRNAVNAGKESAF